MTDLPPGWTLAPLGTIAETRLGKMLDRGRTTGHSHVRYLRNSNVQWGHINLQDVLTMEMSPADVEIYNLRPGDLLVCEGGEIGRCAIWRREESMAYQKALHRVRPSEAVSAEYLGYFLEDLARSGELARLGTGSTIKHLPQQRLRGVMVPLAPRAEQDRIVVAIDSHLGSVQEAVRIIEADTRHINDLARRIILASIPDTLPAHWTMTTVADAGSIDLGRQRHPDWHTGRHMHPYLRVANVFEDRLDLSDLMEMDFPPEVFERFKLRTGDILLNEGQSVEYLGRPAMYRGEPAEIAFTNSLLRFQAGADVDPEWALLVFRHHLHSGRFASGARVTTNIAHLSASRFKIMQFPVPPLGEQAQIAGRVRAQLATIARLSEAVDAARQHAADLRSAVLRAAFSGRLAPGDPQDEPAETLVQRVCGTTQLPRGRAKPASPRRQPLPAPASTFKIPAGVQETLL